MHKLRKQAKACRLPETGTITLDLLAHYVSPDVAFIRFSTSATVTILKSP